MEATTAEQRFTAHINELEAEHALVRDASDRCAAMKDGVRCANRKTAPDAGAAHPFCRGPHRYE